MVTTGRKFKCKMDMENDNGKIIFQKDEIYEEVLIDEIKLLKSNGYTVEVEDSISKFFFTLLTN